MLVLKSSQLQDFQITLRAFVFIIVHAYADIAVACRKHHCFNVCQLHDQKLLRNPKRLEAGYHFKGNGLVGDNKTAASYCSFGELSPPVPQIYC